MYDARNLVNIADYPIHIDGEKRDTVLNSVRESLAFDGTSDLIKVLELEPGDLQLFRGRYSLHRVSPLVGPTPRYVAIFSYVEQPDMVGSPERTKQLYGRYITHSLGTGRETQGHLH